MTPLNLSVPVQTELYFLDLDKQKLRNFYREHDFSNMAKQKQMEHDKIHQHLMNVKKDQKRNAIYTSMTGCAEMDETKKKRKKNKDSGSVENHCKYSIYDCGGAMNHRTNWSIQCCFDGINHSGIGTYPVQKYDILIILNYYSQLSVFPISTYCNNKS